MGFAYSGGLAGCMLGLIGCDPCVVPCEVGEACLIAGTGDAGLGEDGRCGAETVLYLPSWVGFGPTGALEVVDFNNWRVRRRDEDGVFTTVAGNGTHAGATLDLPPIESPLENPISAAVLPDGSWLLAEYHVPRVLKVGPSGLFEAWAGTGLPGTAGVDGAAVNAELGGPTCLVPMDDGGAWIVDSLTNRLLRVDADGQLTEPTFRFPGSGERWVPDRPDQAVWDSTTGTLLLSEPTRHWVLRLSPELGRAELFAGTGFAGATGDGGVADSAYFDGPRGLAIDDSGATYIGDAGNHVIRRVSPEGLVTRFAGRGRLVSVDGNRLTRDQWSVRTPAGLSWDGSSRALLVADQTGHRIWQVPVE